MKRTLLGLFSLAVLYCSVSCLSRQVVREAIFTQWLDHFDHEARGTFDQVVYINDEHYQPGGPILVLVSATSEDYKFWVENSHMVNIAVELGCVIYALEPRYFGRNYPTTDLSSNNLRRYLQINQTIADYVDFITFLKQELIIYDSNKFILIGHGRGGTLAQWIHQTNPELANGVWAISAPYLTEADFRLYYFGMWRNFVIEFPDECRQTIYDGFAELEALVNNGEIDRIRNIFQFNSDFDLEIRNDVALFYKQLLDLLFTPIEFGTRRTIDVICVQFEATNEFSALELLGQFYSPTLQHRVFKYETFVGLLKEESLDSAAVLNHERQNLYIACTGWSLFKTSSYLCDRFPFEVFADICYDVFGVLSDEIFDGNSQINYQYSIQDNIPNVYFTNAEFDPHWQISVVKDKNPSSPADLISGVGKLHEFFMHVSSDSDSAKLQAVRARIVQLIIQWTKP